MKLNTFLHFSMNKFSFVELYAKCVKEGHIEWTRPEKAIETTKNAWQKAKLRLVMLSAGAIIEITCSKVKYYVIFLHQIVCKMYICSKLGVVGKDLNSMATRMCTFSHKKSIWSAL